MRPEPRPAVPGEARLSPSTGVLAMIGQGLYWISKALLVLASFLAFLLTFVVVADVAGRVMFNSPLKGTPELVSSSIVIICYLQAVYAILSGGMMHVDAITAHMPARVQSVLEIGRASCRERV